MAAKKRKAEAADLEEVDQEKLQSLREMFPRIPPGIIKVAFFLLSCRMCNLCSS